LEEIQTSKTKKNIVLILNNLYVILLLLDDPASAHRVSKFFLVTRELLQFKHVNEPVASGDQNDPFEKTLGEDF
jgi:hypothetical protein